MKKAPSLVEFIVLIALMISLVALTTDIMLPALGVIPADLGSTATGNGHLIVSVLFVGFALGQLVAGPLSDSFGRRPVIHCGYVLFVVGTLVCLFATSFPMLLAGRLLQGLSMAAPRIVAVAIVRDGYAGRSMAKIMSFVMAVFILVPAVAPSIGQALILLSDWRATFAFLLFMAAVTWTWFAFRQPETLALQNRRAFSLSGIWNGIRIILRIPAAIGYTLCAGIIFGPFLAYLSIGQHIFHDIYFAGDAFAFWFGVGALSIGIASILNSRLVERLGMRFLSTIAMFWIIGGSGIFLITVAAAGGVPSFAGFMTWLIVTLFSMGLLFGNLNALAMEPLGEMAGLGAAVVGALSTAIALPLGYAISVSLERTITPLVLGFGLAGIAALLLSRWAGGKSA
jgi:DHA1 family bicyclomycin/chloramphenicol resistance-like MFS transporter